MKTRILVFGVFDLFHPGHEFFLEEAAKLGDELVVVVGRDSSALRRKGRVPIHDQEMRISRVSRFPCVTTAVLSDENEGRYEVIAEWRPDIVAFGHDQHSLAGDLLLKIEQGVVGALETVFLAAHEPERYSSSKIRLSL